MMDRQPLHQAPMQENAMSRRMKMTQKSPLATVNEALQALDQMPDDIKQQYAEPLLRTQMALERQAKNGN